MKTGTRLFYLCLLALLTLPACRPAAALEPAKWKVRLEPADIRAGEYGQIVAEATIDEGWHVYGTNKPKAEFGPKPTALELLPSKALKATGKVTAPAPHKELDQGFNIEVEYYEQGVAFGVPVQVLPSAKGAQTATLNLQYMTCKDGSCLPPKRVELPVKFTVSPGAARKEHSKPVTTPPTQPAGYQAPDAAAAITPPVGGSDAGGPAKSDSAIAQKIDKAKSQGAAGLLGFLLLSLVAGFSALLTPCVFPMVPITVSFFSKQQETAPGGALRGAIAYCLGIIGTFTVLGLVCSIIFGATGISKIAAHPVTNLVFGIVFAVLALNLFGVFEIILPGSLVEKAQSGTQKQGLWGPVLMGLTFTLTSFTCTVAFVGTLLASAARGDYLWPILGMLTFSTAFASPFFFLALFPQYLARMPKAGGWLVTVKGYMGFLELAAALKFISNADLVWQWGLLTRPVFISIWFALFVIAGCYLLGWLRLPHDAVGSIGALRRVIGVGTIAAGVVLLTVLNGGALGVFQGFFPPREYGATSMIAGDVKWLDNYEEAVQTAKRENKPIFIDFTGVTCTNCRVIEDTVFTRREVQEELSKFVTVRLYTDKDTKESNGYQKLQEQKYGQTTLPLYAVEDPEGKKIAERDYDPPKPETFIRFMQEARGRAIVGEVAQNP